MSSGPNGTERPLGDLPHLQGRHLQRHFGHRGWAWAFPRSITHRTLTEHLAHSHRCPLQAPEGVRRCQGNPLLCGSLEGQGPKRGMSGSRDLAAASNLLTASGSWILFRDPGQKWWLVAILGLGLSWEISCPAVAQSLSGLCAV